MPCETEEAVVQPEQVKLDLPGGVPPLRSLYIYASGSCNLACRHCWIVPEYLSAEVGSEDGRHVPLEYVDKAIREGKSVGLGSAKLTGGEPTLHPRFRELVTLLTEAGLNISIETNGTLVDDELAAFLKATPQVTFISVSLDGVDAETHDGLRGVRGSHERAVAGIKALVRAGFRPQVICTLHKGNVDQVDAMIALAGELGCESIKFNLVQEMGRGEEFAGQQGLPLAEIVALNQRVERDLVPQSKVSVYFDVPFAFRPLSRLLKGDLGRCGVRSILGLLSGGELSLCGVGTTIPELIYGHIAQDSLRDVWCESPGLALLREQIPYQLEGVCRTCLHRDICLGSCIANNYHAAGRLNAPYMFCHRAEALGLFPASRKR